MRSFDRIYSAIMEAFCTLSGVTFFASTVFSDLLKRVFVPVPGMDHIPLIFCKALRHPSHVYLPVAVLGKIPGTVPYRSSTPHVHLNFAVVHAPIVRYRFDGCVVTPLPTVMIDMSVTYERNGDRPFHVPDHVRIVERILIRNFFTRDPGIRLQTRVLKMLALLNGKNGIVIQILKQDRAVLKYIDVAFQQFLSRNPFFSFSFRLPFPSCVLPSEAESLLKAL